MILDNKLVKQITPYLDDTYSVGNPFSLLQNADKSFQGTIVLGKGFIVEPHETMRLIEKNPENKDVLFPYLNGEDLNKNPDQSPSRWVINFFDWPEEKCLKEYTDCFAILEEKVKPQRAEIIAKGKQIHTYNFWQYWDRRAKLYHAIELLERVLVVAQTSKTLAFCFEPTGYIYSMMCIIFPFCKYRYFSMLQNSFHFHWCYKYGSTMKTDLRYTPSDVFETFPFPQNQIISTETESLLEKIGERYHNHRQQLMLGMQLGLTKTYNQFHNKQLAVIPDDLSESEIEKKYGKETLNLRRHLSRTVNTYSLSDAVAGILELRRLHKEMDETVLKAYGWADINLGHDFYEVEYLPENDRIRYTISPAARREVLKRLLELNHKIHAREIATENQTESANKPRKGKKKKTSDTESMTF